MRLNGLGREPGGRLPARVERDDDDFLDRLIAFDLGLSGAPRIGPDQDVIDLILGMEPVWHGWRAGKPMAKADTPTAANHEGAAGGRRPRPPGRAGPRDPQREQPKAPYALTDVPGQILFKDEQPEVPIQRLTPEQDQELLQMLEDGARPEQLRQFARSKGLLHFGDKFDEAVRLIDEGYRVANHVEYRLPEAPAQPDGAIGAAARGLGDPFNLLDELGAVADTLGGTKGRENVWNSDRSLKDILHGNIDANRAILRADQRDHPVARTGGQIVSNLILPIGNKATTARQLAKWGAGEGFLGGLGAGEGNVIERLPDAAAGGTLGAVVGYGGGRSLEKSVPLYEWARSRLGIPVVGPHGPIYRHLSNDYPAARDRLIAEQTGEVPGLLSHPEMGKIDVIWGDGSGGLAHIHDKHPEVLDDLPAIVEGLPVVHRPHDTPNNKFVLQDEQHKSVVAPDFHGEPKQWMVTTHERKDAPGDETIGRNPLSPDGKIFQRGAERSIDVPGAEGKIGGVGAGPPPPGSSPETAIPINDVTELQAIRSGSWVVLPDGRRFPKS